MTGRALATVTTLRTGVIARTGARTVADDAVPTAAVSDVARTTARARGASSSAEVDRATGTAADTAATAGCVSRTGVADAVGAIAGCLSSLALRRGGDTKRVPESVLCAATAGTAAVPAAGAATDGSEVAGAGGADGSCSSRYGRSASIEVIETVGGSGGGMSDESCSSWPAVLPFQLSNSISIVLARS